MSSLFSMIKWKFYPMQVKHDWCRLEIIIFFCIFDAIVFFLAGALLGRNITHESIMP